MVPLHVPSRIDSVVILAANADHIIKGSMQQCWSKLDRGST